METNENEDTTIHNFGGYSKSSPEREIRRNTSIHPKAGKNSKSFPIAGNTKADLAPKGAGEGTTNILHPAEES